MTRAEQANQKANDIINGKAEASSISMGDLPSFWQQVDPALQPALFQSLFGIPFLETDIPEPFQSLFGTSFPETDTPEPDDVIDACISLSE